MKGRENTMDDFYVIAEGEVSMEKVGKNDLCDCVCS